MCKLIFPAIIVFILMTGSASFFTACQSRTYLENSAFRAIPVKTPLIIEVPDLESLLKKTGKEHELISELKLIKELQAFFSELDDLKSLFKENEPLRKILSHKPVLVAFNDEGKNNTGCLYASGLQSRNEKSELLRFFNELATSKRYGLSKRLYDNEEIYQLKTGGTNFHFAFKDGIFLFSRYALFIEESIRQIVAQNLMDKQEFKDLYKTVGSESDFNIYINHQKFPGFISGAVPYEIKKNLQVAGSFADWTELDVHINQTEVLLNGFSFSNDSNNNYLNVFRRQKAVKSKITEVLPSNTSLFISLTVEDLESFYIDYEEYLKKQGLYYARETKLKNIERYSKTSFIKLFKELAQKDFAVAFGPVTQNEPVANRFFIAGVKGQSIAREKLLPMLDYYAKANETDLQQTQTDYQVQNGPSFEIYEMPFPNLPELLFGQAFASVESNYLCFYDNYLIFADNLTALKNYIHNLVLSETLANDTRFQKFNQQMSSRSCFYFYMNFSRAFYLGNYYLNEHLTKTIETNEPSIRKFYALGWQFSENSGNFLNTLYLKFEPVLKEEPQTIWQSRLDSTVAIKPQFVDNHLDKVNKEIIVQDNKNNLYLINKEGLILWKVKLPGKILGEIHQIDYYRNRKLQYLFNTRDQLHLLDRNGNKVAKFPINFRSTASNGIAVFDYDNNRNYRFFVACENKQVYAYDRDGKLVSGWNFKGSDGLVTNPVKHFRVAEKDYIVFADQYTSYILNRQGDTRVKTANFEHSGNELFLSGKGQMAVAATDMNGTVHLQYFDGHQEKDIRSFSKNHFFEAEDLTGDGLTDFIFADKNILYAFHGDGKKLFERKFNNNISGKPNIYTFTGGGKKIGVVCRDGNRVYLVNANGSIYEGFPLQGNTDFTVGYFNRSNPYFNLIVGSEDNRIYHYQIE